MTTYRNLEPGETVTADDRYHVPAFAAPELCRAVVLTAAYELWDVVDDNRSARGRRNKFLWAAVLGDHISAGDFLRGFKVTQ